MALINDEISKLGYSAEYYLQLEAEFDVVAFTQRIYAPGTENLQSRIKRLWQSYCIITKKDPILALEELTINVLYTFFDWLLFTRKGTLGAASTIQTYWNVLCLLRRQETKCHEIPPLLKSQMNGVREQLAIKYHLRTEKKPKPIMRAEDEFELLKTLFLSPDVVFNHERHRIQLALIMQLAGITGNRPAALLGVCYKHVKVTLLADPMGGERPRVMLEVTYKNTKRYHGDKDPNEFGIPDVQDEPCLLLCPHITFLAIIFADQAFAASSLTSPDQLFRLRVPCRQRQLPLPFKEELQETPVFRRCVRTALGVEISKEDALLDSTLRPQMVSLGTITGMELPTVPYTFRRGNGEALDNSSFITETQRNLVLQHGNSNIFQKNYASRYMPDTQAAYRGLQPQTSLMRAASGMSRSIDHRRPRQLTAAQQAEVRRNPEVKLLNRTLQSLRRTLQDEKRSFASMKGTPLHQQYQKVQQTHRNVQRRCEKAALKDVKARYKIEQPVIDIQRQLEGTPVMNEEDLMVKSYNLKERDRVVDTLFTFATGSPEQECRRRSDAINALLALCKKQEGRGFRRRKDSSKTIKPQQIGSADTSLSLSPPIDCKPTQCIFCLGNEGLPVEKRTKEFSVRSSLKKHFKRAHLRHHPQGQPIACPHPKCSEILNNTKLLQNHAEIVHRTPT